MKYILIGVGVLVVLELAFGVSVLGFITNKGLTAQPGGDGPATTPASAGDVRKGVVANATYSSPNA